MNRMNPSPSSGAALVVSLIVMVVLFGLGMTYATLSFSGYESSQRDEARLRAVMASEEGIYLAIAELKTEVDPGGDGLGVVSFVGDDERQIQTMVQDLGGDLYRVHSQATISRAELAGEVLVQIEDAIPINFNTRGAINAQGPVDTTGTINVDGRDWDYTGSFIIGDGTFGISTMSTIGTTGASTVGGKGKPPANPPPAGSIEPNAVWANGIDDDGDGAIDEEPFNGFDDDGDGLLDEDVSGYPETPDAMVGVPPGTLKAGAQAVGTYFASQTELNDYIAANGGNIPGGVVLFLDFQKWQPAELGELMNDPPSVIIHHTDAGDAVMKNVHGSFKGLIFADFVEHLNGDFTLLGALMSFADEAYGNTFGNGSANILYSSEVLMNLPSAGPPERRARVLSWSRAAKVGG